MTVLIAGKSSATRLAMITITVSNSIRVKPRASSRRERQKVVRHVAPSASTGIPFAWRSRLPGCALFVIDDVIAFRDGWVFLGFVRAVADNHGR